MTADSTELVFPATCHPNTRAIYDYWREVRLSADARTQRH